MDIDSVYRDHAADLRQFAYRRTADRDMAADLVQEAFAKYAAALRGDERRRAVEQPRPFLQRTIANMVIDTLRRRGRRGRSPALDDLAEEPADSEVLPDSTIADREQLALLRSCLDTLPEREREALILNRVEDMTHAQIAHRMNVSPSMVSKYIMSALRRLKQRLPTDLG